MNNEKELGGVQYLAKCVLRGSAVLHVVHGHLRSLSTSDTVFGKETSLELVVVNFDGNVQTICEQPVFGIIKSLAVLPWNEKFREPTPQTNGKDLLVVLSDSGKLSFLVFSSEMHRFFALTHVELSKPGNSLQQLGNTLAVASNGSFVAVSALEDRFALFTVSKSAGSNIIGERIFYPPENKGEPSTYRDSLRIYIRGTIWSMCFISDGCNSSSNERYNPILAMIMRRKCGDLNDLLLFGYNSKTHVICLLSRHSGSEPLALSICPIHHLPGFAFIFRVGDVLLMDLRYPRHVHCVHILNFNSPGDFQVRCSAEVPFRDPDFGEEGFNMALDALLELRNSGVNVINNDDPMSIDIESGKSSLPSKFVCSWSWEPGESAYTKLVVCLDSGELYIIETLSDDKGIKVGLSECVYSGLPCKDIQWIDGEFIVGLVEMGDGLILKLEDGRLLYKSPIQNIAPILDFTTVDYHDEKQDQIFACCGVSPNGSLRIIRSGISVERLLRTEPIYRGITGLWTLRMKETDPYHSFLVLSFVEETRVLSVGLSFTDISDASGFQLDCCTLACDMVSNRLLVQIQKNGVRLCLPTTFAHPEGVPLSTPICTSWHPTDMSISLGVVGCNLIIVATSNPCFLFILGVRSVPDHRYEIYEIQHMRLEHEVSCISMPRYEIMSEVSPTKGSRTFVIGTHKPSVEILSLEPGGGWKIHASASISIESGIGTLMSGCIPEDVRLVLVDRPYVLCGLRNGMLLRFEWPEEKRRESQLSPFCFSKMEGCSASATVDENSMPDILQLIANRRIGNTPVSLVSLRNSLDADIIIHSDKLWLLHSARHSLAYTSIPFQPVTHVTPVCSTDCPMGILFVAENALHLVEVVHSLRLNAQKFSIDGTPRKILYHGESKTLLVMRSILTDASCSSDICRVDPSSGTLLSRFKCEPGEIAKCMQIVKVGNEQFLVVGTSQSSGRIILPSGEADSALGRLIVLDLDMAQSSSNSSSLIHHPSLGSSEIVSPLLRNIVRRQLMSSSICSSPEDTCSDGFEHEERDVEQFRITFQTVLHGAVLAVSPFLDRYVLASAGNILNVFGFPNENTQRLRKLAVGRTRFTITCLTTLYSRIVVGDCRDGILFFSYHEDQRKLELLYSDPVQRLVADCALLDLDTAVVSDRRGNISILSCTNLLEGNESPEKNLLLNCSFYLGETVMSIRKGLLPYKLPLLDCQNSCDGAEFIFECAYSSIIASTLLGSVFIIIPIASEEYELLEAVQARLVLHRLTSPILGNDHKEFRGRGSKGVPTIIDGDMLAQFLELTTEQQEDVLASSTDPSARASSSHPSQPPILLGPVVRLIEQVHDAIN